MEDNVLKISYEMHVGFQAKDRDDFSDVTTVEYYPRVVRGFGHHAQHYLFSIRHQLLFFEAVGLGPLKTEDGDGLPPFKLSEAAKYCLQITKKKKDTTLFLAVKKQTSQEFSTWVANFDQKQGKFSIFIIYKYTI